MGGVQKLWFMERGIIVILDIFSIKIKRAIKNNINPRVPQQVFLDPLSEKHIKINVCYHHLHFLFRIYLDFFFFQF